jgi:osmotically-inducible protein OsmY
MRAQLSLGVAAALIVALGCAQPGSDANVGPSDATITASVKEKLASLEGQKIEAMAQNGVVRLTGTVDNADVKAEAVTLARGTEGVTEIVDFITVGPAADPQPSSAPTTNNAPTDSDPPPTGGEHIGHGSDIGEGAGSGMPDFSGPPVTDASINDKVKAALQESPQLRGMTIDAVTRLSVVTLSGTVNSEEAKKRAADVASKVARVIRVDNQLTVRQNTRP